MAAIQPNADAESAHEGAAITLIIEGPGITLRRTISETQLVRVLAVAMSGGEGGILESGVGLSTTASKDDRPESLAEFYNAVGPKQYPEKLTTMGAYLHKVAQRQSFELDELKSMFRQVAEPTPANIHRDIAKAVGKGWIAKDQEGGLYVTNTGYRAMETSFSSEVKRAPVRRRKRRVRGPLDRGSE
jgi:hypothetical protein